MVRHEHLEQKPGSDIGLLHLNHDLYRNIPVLITCGYYRQG